jgi:prolyl 4-hydroxylase
VKDEVMSQAVTTELREWILAQAHTGQSPVQVLDAMKQVGWSEDVAIAAMEEVMLASGQPQTAAALAGLKNQRHDKALPGALLVPDIDLTGSPRRIDVGDRMVDVVLAMQSPRVVLISGFLSDEECDALVAAAQPRLSRSLTVQTSTGGEEVNEARTSNGMFFDRGESVLLNTIEARIARMVNWPVEHGEGIQVLHYLPGAEYKPHYDYFDPEQPGSASILRRGGQRVATLVMYLNDPQAGGGTTFPDVGLEVAPRKGSVVFFNYDRPHPATRSLHGGAPVVAGDKWVATKWLREGVFV